jgi:hypothetical protein
MVSRTPLDRPDVLCLPPARPPSIAGSATSMRLGHHRPHRDFSPVVEQIRIDLRHHVEGNPVLKRKQIIQMPVETSAPEHLEMQRWCRR